jgi:hypothetical protein
LDPSIARVNERSVKWRDDENIKLKDAVQRHGGKNWDAIAALVPGRTPTQCCSRWHDGLNPSIDRANECMGKWAEDEDTKLKDAVETYGGKKCGVIAALVPGRTKSQCCSRWTYALHPSIALTLDVPANGQKTKTTN